MVNMKAGGLAKAAPKNLDMASTTNNRAPITWNAFAHCWIQSIFHALF